MAEATPTEPIGGQDTVWDEAVVGGGAAGLSGALALAQSRRSVLVIDAGQSRNTPAARLQNYLSRDGTALSQLLETGRDEVIGHGEQIVTGTVTSSTRAGDGTSDCSSGTDRRRGCAGVLVTTGLVPTLGGCLSDELGRDVAPRLHGSAP
jgi:thioredoxin reductase